MPRRSGAAQGAPGDCGRTRRPGIVAAALLALACAGALLAPPFFCGGAQAQQNADDDPDKLFRRADPIRIVYLQEDISRYAHRVDNRKGLPRVEARASGGQTLTYSLEGRDGHRFTIDGEGAIWKRPDRVYDYETETRRCGEDDGPCYEVTVRATAFGGSTGTRRVQVRLEDRDEGPRLRLRTPRGAGELEAEWDAAPERDGGGRLTGYALRYVRSVHVVYDGVELPVVRFDETDDRFVNTLGPSVTRHRFTGLDPGIEYRVRVQARYHNGYRSIWEEARALTGTGSDAPPALESAAVREDDSGVLSLQFSEALDTGSLPPPGAFTVAVNGVRFEGGSHVTAPSGAQNRRIDLEYGAAVQEGDTVTVSYARPRTANVLRDAAGRLTLSYAPPRTVNFLRDARGREIASFRDFPVTNAYEIGPGIDAPTAPRGVFRTDGGRAIRIAFSSQLSRSSAHRPPTGAFTVTADGQPVSIGDVSVPALTGRPDTDVHLTRLSPPIRAGQTVSIGYVKPARRGLRSTVGRDVDSFSGLGLGGSLTGLRVVGGSATEGLNAFLDFSVWLSAASTETVTVDYATADGSATAPADYTSTSDTLTFAPGETSKTVSVPIVDDSVEDGGETFTLVLSNASGAPILDSVGTGTINNDEAATAEADPLTASFVEVPDAHGGAAFTVKLRFSEEFPLEVATLRDHALGVTGGTLGDVAQTVSGENRAWTVAVTPDAGEGDVTVTLAAAQDCAAAGAICTVDGRALAAAVSATVPHAAAATTTREASPALTASFAPAPPVEHDGASAIGFRVAFSENLKSYGWQTMRDSSLAVTQGGTRLVPKVSRVHRNDAARKNQAWDIQVTPLTRAAIEIALQPSPACGTEGAMCTGDGRRLEAGVSATVAGPPGLSVADARVDEGADATLDFAVTLGRASTSTVTVDYATSDGTATAGADYTAASGTLSFAPGETAKTVSVAVLDDAHDEGEETMTLTLSNPSGGNAWLADASATGTIVNADAMPRAWLARFGRTVAEQAIEAVEGRFAAPRAAGVAVTLAGERIGLSGARPEDPGSEAGAGEARAKLAAMTRWLRGAEETSGESGRAGNGSRGVTPRDLLTGSSFALTGEAKAGGRVSFWGRGAVSRFDGRAGDLTLDGEVASAMLGADLMRGRWTAGLMVSRSEGAGSYRGEGAGTVESTLTALWPYGRYAASERLTVWGLAGWGEGDLVLTPEGPDGESRAAIRTDMDMVMGALGLRGVAVEAGPDGGVELAVTSDAMAVRTSSEKVEGLAAAEADATRLRLGLEGTWRGLALGGGALGPRLEIGLRHDGGDAETGFGLDLGGGLSWSHPQSGLSAELSGRGLLTHESKGFRDRGLAGSFAWDPGQGSGRGPRLTLIQTVGSSSAGGMAALLGRDTLAGLAANENGSDDLANRRLELRLGYGFPAFGERFTATPEAGLGLANGSRAYSLGWRLALAGGGPDALALGLEATRSESANDNAEPEHGARVRLTARW